MICYFSGKYTAMNAMIEFITGGEKHIIFTNNILLIREDLDGSSCNIYVKDFDDPFYYSGNLDSLKNLISPILQQNFDR